MASDISSNRVINVLSTSTTVHVAHWDFFSLGLVEINTYAVILLEADFKFQFICPDNLDKLAPIALFELVYFLALMLLANAFLLDSQFFCHYDEWLKSGENTLNTPTLEWIFAVLHHLRNISIA